MRDSNKDLLLKSKCDYLAKKHEVSNMAMLQLMRKTFSPYNKYVPHGLKIVLPFATGLLKQVIMIKML